MDAGLLADYARHLHAQHHSANYLANQLTALTRLWAYAPFLRPADRVPMPPWDAAGGRYDLLEGASASGNENTTPPVHPAVMSPLLVWALRMVTDFGRVAAHVGIDEVIAEVQPMPRPAGTGTAVYGYRRGHRGR